VPDLIKTVEANIRSRKLLERGQTIVIAVSGGVDSVVLLDVICQLRRSYGWKIHVAHLNHQLRGKESDGDEKLVRQTARAKKLRLTVGSADIARMAREQKISIEMAARSERHAFLARTASKAKARTLVLAHHADDQVELFFLRLFRGTGIEGLAGMKWKSPSPANKDIQLVRPLLNVTKRDLLTYAAEHSIKYREDATNQSLDIRRNRIRHELLPLIREHYQQGIGASVMRLGEILSAESEFLANAARDWMKTRTPDFSKLDPALQRRVLQSRLAEKGVPADFDLIEKLRLAPGTEIAVSPVINRLAESTKPAANEKAIGVLLSRDKNGDLMLRINRARSFSTNRKQVALSARAGQFDFAGLSLQWEKEAHRRGQLPRFKPGCEWFDADLVGDTILMRHWAPGDCFQPIGMPKPVKLQDIFVNRKIPRLERPGLALATTASGEIFWVEKLRISERFKLSSRTKCRLKWQWQRA
jgi:tRNA(Ile)-lysidine synthase